MRRRAIHKKKGGIPTGNLVLYNRFDGNLTDETGNHTLSSSGISYTNGIYSGVASEAVEFDASTDYIRIPDADALSFGDGSSDSPFSVLTCINGNNLGTSNAFLLNKRGSVSTNNREYQLLSTTTPNLQFNLWDQSAGGSIGRRGNTTLSNSTNYCIIVTYDGSGSESGIKIYIDAVEESSYTIVNSGSYTAMENTTADVVLGVAAYSTIPRYSGLMDETGIWNKELSQAEVTAIYNKISGGNSLL